MPPLEMIIRVFSRDPHLRIAMMIRRSWTLRCLLISLASALSIISISTRSRAQSFVGTPNQRFTIDLNTGGGNSSAWINKNLGSATGLRATIEISKIEMMGRPAPSFAIAVGTVDTGSGLLLVASKRSSAIRLYAVVQNRIVKTLGQAIGLKESVDINLDWHRAGIVTLRVGGGRIHQLAAPAQVTALLIASRSGELKIKMSLGQLS
jgi:hypothetical protein